MLKLATLLVLLVILMPKPTYGQALQTFLPKECKPAAQSSAEASAPGSRLVAIINGAFEFDFAGTTYGTGMRLSDGKANAWIYAFFDSVGDSVIFKPFGKVPFIGCTDASQFLPVASVPGSTLGSETVPGAFIEGSALISALNADGDYTAYRTAYPDSMPNATVLTVSREPVLDYPSGTPFWFLTWTPSQEQSGMTCFVHALSSETICVRVVSVADDAVAAGFTLAPNPAFDYATVTIPMSWLGTTATIEAVDATGSSIVLASDVLLLSPALNISLVELQSGMYTIRIRNERNARALPMSVVR